MLGKRDGPDNREGVRSLDSNMTKVMCMRECMILKLTGVWGGRVALVGAGAVVTAFAAGTLGGCVQLETQRALLERETVYVEPELIAEDSPAADAQADAMAEASAHTMELR